MALQSSLARRSTNGAAVRSTSFQAYRQCPWSFGPRSQAVMMGARTKSAAESRDPNRELVDIVERAMLSECGIEPGDTLVLAVR